MSERERERARERERERERLMSCFMYSTVSEYYNLY